MKNRSLPQAIPEVQIRGQWNGDIEFVLCERLGDTHVTRGSEILKVWDDTVFVSDAAIFAKAHSLAATAGAKRIRDNRTGRPAARDIREESDAAADERHYFGDGKV